MSGNNADAKIIYYFNSLNYDIKRLGDEMKIRDLKEGFIFFVVFVICAVISIISGLIFFSNLFVDFSFPIFVFFVANGVFSIMNFFIYLRDYSKKYLNCFIEHRRNFVKCLVYSYCEKPDDYYSNIKKMKKQSSKLNITEKTEFFIQETSRIHIGESISSDSIDFLIEKFKEEGKTLADKQRYNILIAFIVAIVTSGLDVLRNAISYNLWEFMPGEANESLKALITMNTSWLTFLVFGVILFFLWIARRDRQSGYGPHIRNYEYAILALQEMKESKNIKVLKGYSKSNLKR